MDGMTNEELLELVEEMDDGDLMEVCDEVGIDWTNLSGEAEMRAALRDHYGLGSSDDKQKAVSTGGNEGEEGEEREEKEEQREKEGEEKEDENNDELEEQRELIGMMDYDDALQALQEEKVEILEETLDWMQCALLAHLTGRQIPAPGAKWGQKAEDARLDFDDEGLNTAVANRPQASTDPQAPSQPQAAAVVHSGYLSKVMEGAFKSRLKPQRLYFELMPSSLVYYDKPGGKRLRQIDLSTAADIRAQTSLSTKDPDQATRAMHLVTPLRTWELHADDPAQAGEWIDILRKQQKVINDSLVEEAGLDLDDDDVIESAFAMFETYATGDEGEEVVTKQGLDVMLREEIGFAMNQEYVNAVFNKFDTNDVGFIDVDEFLGIYRFMYMIHVAHLHAFEEGYAEEREDEDGSGAKIGSKEWLKAWKQAIIKKSSEEGFQDKAIRVTVSLISVAIMLIMLYGAIGLLSGQGVKQLPCETTQPCRNGAQCRNSNPYGNNTYLCECIDGWAGVNCESDYDECLELPCLNGGACVNERNSYDCQCRKGFRGRDCEIDVNECDSSPCVRGVCGDLDVGYQCMCPPGFNGTECQLDTDECQSNPCQTGRCHDGFDRYSCVCDAGFSGRECEVDNDECFSRPCQNDGNCSAQPAREAAMQTILNRSIPATEVNLSTARLHELSNLLRTAGIPRSEWDTSDSYTCNCAPGYAGSTCHEDVNECASDPCVHGICIEHETTYQCSCERDWEGENCEVASAFAYWYEFEAPSGQVADVILTNMSALLELNATIGEDVRDTVITSLYQGVVVTRELVKTTVETRSMQKAISVTTMLASGTQLPDGWSFLASNFESCDYHRLPRISIDPGSSEAGRMVLLREAQAESAGWTNPEITYVGSAGWVHGPWGNDERDVQINIPIPEGLTMCQVSWRSWMADSRDREVDSVHVDGNIVWEAVAGSWQHGCSEAWTDGGAEFPDYPNPWQGENGQVCYADVEVEVPCNGGGNMNLRFRSQINQGERDESWAFSNVTVTARKATTLVDCIANHGYNLPLRTADGDLAVDLFILQDLSASFRNDLINLRANVANMHELLGQMFQSPRVGFGGFIDKPTNNAPAIYCYNTFSDLADMTADDMATAFNNMNALGNYDKSETSLSSLYAIAKRAQLPDGHSEKIHFSSFMKVVLVATDAGWKDEYVAEPPGVVRPQDTTTGCDAEGICEDGCDQFPIPPAQEVYYGDEPYWAYVDIQTVRDALQDADIVPLFAVTANQVSEYEALNQALGGRGFVTPLASDSSNFDDAILIGLGKILEAQQNLTFPPECTPGDECASQPCQHGGICTDDPYSPHQCVCVGDFTGGDCQYETDDCCSYPCDNGADCSDLDSAYVCNCHPGYTGENCAEQVEECNSSPCLNDATCEDVSINAYRCHCVAGWSGHNCDEDVYECRSIPCRNHAACADSSDVPSVAIDAFECTCRQGFVGLTCAEDVDECLSSPCLNAANCFDGEDDYWCSCREGYSGLLCENEADYCESAPCLNDGVCNSLSTNPPTYSCDCGAGYMGSNCHLDIDECTEFEPGEHAGCRNGAECSDSNVDGSIPVLEYRCTCLSGFEGSDCENMINPCEKGFGTALGHGCDLATSTCVWSGPSSYACECVEGYFLQDGSGHESGWVCEEEFPWILFIGCLLLCCFLSMFFGFYAFQYRRMLRLPLVVGTLDLDKKTNAAILLNIRAMATDTVSALKGQIEITSGVVAREQRVFIVMDEESTIYLEDDKCLGDYGIARRWSAPRMQDWSALIRNPFEIPFFVLPEKHLLELQMMQCWQIFVQVKPPPKSSESPIVIVLDVVVPHWRVESVKLKIEDKTGVKSQHQRLSHQGETLLDGQRIKDYPAIQNMDTIELVDETPQDKPKKQQEKNKPTEAPKETPKLEAPKETPKMKADSVLTMAKMFQAGHAPGANLSELQERSMLAKRKKSGPIGGPVTSTIGQGESFENPIGPNSGDVVSL